MERLGTTDAAAARREIERSDAAHAGIVRGFFGVDWQNPLIYHLVLDTGSVPIETCVTIVRFLAENQFQETEETRSVLANKLVESRVRAALGDAFATPIDIRMRRQSHLHRYDDGPDWQRRRGRAQRRRCHRC